MEMKFIDVIDQQPTTDYKPLRRRKNVNHDQRRGKDRGLKIVRSIDEDQWRNFIDNHPQSNIFHTPDMFEVFSRTKNFKAELWGATDNHQVLALFLPVRITLMDRLILRRLTSRSVAYGSVLWQPNVKGREALSLLLETYNYEVKKSLLFTELRNLSNLDVIQPVLRKSRFIYEEHLNYLIDINRPPEAIMQSIGRRTRKQIRHGLRQKKVRVEEIDKRQKLTDCYQLLKQSYQVAKVPIADFSLLTSAFDLLYHKNMIRFTVACVDKIPVAASVELLYKDVIYGWYGGVNREYSHLQPNELLMWDILKWGSENRYKVYDFGGAGRPNEDYGVRDFKAKFGGELVCFGRNICTHAPFSLRLSQLGYMLYRSFL